MEHTHTEADLPIENQYPKLVRDKIPAIIKSQGKAAETHVAEQEEYIGYLLSKLVEEATELKNAEGSEHQKEEIADVREVLEAVEAALGFSEHEISKVQDSKRDERGGFADRIILEADPKS